MSRDHCFMSCDLQVRLIDKGDVLTVDVNQLLTLPEEFLTTPPLVIETYICGLRPLDNDIDWPPQVSRIIMILTFL